MTKKILYGSDEAAKKITLTGWVSSNGHFWGDNEHQARWGGCTHTICDCGNEHEKVWTICEECRNKKKIEKYNSMEFKRWDCETPLYSDYQDEYFFDGDMEDYCELNGVKESELMLIICEPNYARQIDDDYWCDDLSEDTGMDEASPEISEALESFNKVIGHKKHVLSWSPGKYRTSINQKGKHD